MSQLFDWALYGILIALIISGVGFWVMFIGWKMRLWQWDDDWTFGTHRPIDRQVRRD